MKDETKKCVVCGEAVYPEDKSNLCYGCKERLLSKTDTFNRLAWEGISIDIVNEEIDYLKSLIYLLLEKAK